MFGIGNLLKFMKRKRPKYGNSKVEYGDITFDSKRERDRYFVLSQAQEDGLISNLALQPKWELIPKITEKFTKHLKTKDKECERTVQHAITYSADFSYNDRYGNLVVEDVKISPSLLQKEFILKVKMMRAIHGIKVRCIYKPNEPIE